MDNEISITKFLDSTPTVSQSNGVNNDNNTMNMTIIQFLE